MNFALPEIIVLSTATIILILDLFKSSPKASHHISIIGLTAACTALLMTFPGTDHLVLGRLVFDSTAIWFKLIFTLSALFAIILAGESTLHNSKRNLLSNACEFNVLLLFTLIGMMLLVSARDIVTIYVSLELATIPLFLLSAWSKNALSSEGGLKYVILGAMSSTLLLFGLSILYGITGEMTIAGIANAIKPNMSFYYSLSLIGAGVGFKLALAPFHMWAPDVYEGAPTPVTAYLSVASKSAGVALAIVLFAGLAGPHIVEFSSALAIVAAITMTLGNMAAIAQHNIKRFMAYSSISQAGYILMGFIGGYPESNSVIIYYLLGYLVTNLAAFTVIILYANQTGREEINEYAGLSETKPLLALVMMVALFSLAGIPPLAGFTGKFFLFSIAAKSGYYWLVTLAAVNSTISLYYYLKIVRQMYIEPALSIPETFYTTRLLALTLAVTFIATIAIGVFPTFYESINSSLL